MKYLYIAMLILLTGCVSEDEAVENISINEGDNVYIVSGQSNATGCDWGYFEGITGSEVISIAKAGYLIDGLIEEYDSEPLVGVNPRGIIFVHGESDAMAKTDTQIYISKVEMYRGMISSDIGRELPLLISTVGYYSRFPDAHFDLIRSAVNDYAKISPTWIVAYNDAKSFRDWGMLSDGLHFTEEGCQVMMEGIAQSL